MNKYLFTSLCAFAAVSFLLVSCKKSAGAAPISVSTMGYGDNSNAEGLSWVRIVKEFEEANPNIKIDYELLYDEAYHQKVTARLASGDIPHLAYMGADARWGTPWKNAGQQWDHREFINKDLYDLNLIPPMGPNGEIYEIPVGTSNITTVLFMNKPLVESLGFSQPETYEDLVAMVPAAQAAGLDVVTIDGADGWALGSCLLSVFIARTSGDPNWISKTLTGEHKFTDPAFVQALGLVERLVKDGVFPAKAVLVDNGSNVSAFNNGKALFMVQGQWAAGSIENHEVADNMTLMAWPVMPGEVASARGSVAAAVSTGYGLTKFGGENPEVRGAGLAFIDYFNGPKEVEQRLRDGAIIAPVLKNFQVPSDLPNVTKQKIALATSSTEVEVIDAFLTGQPNEVLMAGAQKILAGQASPEEVAAEIEASISR